MKKFAFAFAAVALAVSAQAATISTPISQFSNGLSPMEIGQTGSLALFDTSLGDLLSVAFTYGAGISGDITLTYGAAATGNANIRGTTNSTIFFSSTNSAINSLLNPLDLTFNTGFQNMTPGTQFVSATLGDSQSSSPVVAALAALQAAGGGSFDVSCESLSGFGTTGGGGFSGGSQNTFGQCNASIVYTYDERIVPPPAVPEPGSMALVGLALAGLGLTARRRAAK